VKSAEDAFGTSVGNENIGLYQPFDVRGFSAVDAGNVRIDGLYFDRQTDSPSLIAPGSTIRVGISAQGYPLPAPTGIADYALVRVGDTPVVSAIANYGPFRAASLEVDAKLPIAPGRFGLALGGSWGRFTFETGADEVDTSVSVAAQWRPTEGVEIIPFFGRTEIRNSEAGPTIFVGGAYLPPRVKRGRFYGQTWADNHTIGTNYGVVGSTDLGAGWRLKAGVFHSVFEARTGFADLFFDTQPNGMADHVIIADRDQQFASTSGEVRVSNSFETGPLRNTIYLVGRGRDQHRRYGGSDVMDLGPALIGTPAPIAEPAFSFGPQTRDHVRQTTGAVAYRGQWNSLFEVSAGLQKTHYRKTVTEPGQAPQGGRDSPWLYNLGGAIHAGERLAFYGGYTTGLEEGGVAPSNAVNKDSAPPAIRTKQVEAGLRYSITPDLKLVAGVFDVRKPYNNLDQANVFRRLGEERHRGVEISLSGQVAPGLNLVAGTVLQKPRVTGEEVAAGRIGNRPVGQSNRTTIIGADYQIPAIQALSVNATLTSVGDRVASSDNQLSIPARFVLDLGARYRFKIGDAPATLRFSVGNVFNKFGWRTNPAAVFVTNAQRRYALSLAADF
jgi:iron complex outermembrane receptor protein